MKKFLDVIRPKKQWVWVIGKWGGVFAIVLIISLGVFPALTIPKVGLKALVVLSGSMEPAVKTGAVVVIRPIKKVEEGDIVTFRHPQGSPRDLVTHRVTKVETKEDVVEIKTRGDANSVEDSWTIGPGAILGKVAFSVPCLGFVVDFVRKPLGFVIFVIIPALWIVVDEIKKIKRAVEEEYEKKYAKLNAKEAKSGTRKRRKGIQKKTRKKSIGPSEVVALVLVMTLATFTSSSYGLVGTTYAYFSDQDKIEGNTFSAGWWVKPSVTVLSPNGGEVWTGGLTYDITWTASSSDPAATGSMSIDIYYSTDSGGTYPNTIATGEANDGVYSWTLPDVKSSIMRVKVVATDSHGLVGEDTSDADFDPPMDEEGDTREIKESAGEEEAGEEEETGPESTPAPEAVGGKESQEKETESSDAERETVDTNNGDSEEEEEAGEIEEDQEEVGSTDEEEEPVDEEEEQGEDEEKDEDEETGEEENSQEELEQGKQEEEEVKDEETEEEQRGPEAIEPKEDDGELTQEPDGEDAGAS